jgi:hypothetical protein
MVSGGSVRAATGTVRARDRRRPGRSSYPISRTSAAAHRTSRIIAAGSTARSRLAVSTTQ